LVREFVFEVRTAQNLLVIKTSVGSAQPVAAALDEEDWPEAVGPIAGDDTILMVCPIKTMRGSWRSVFRDALASLSYTVLMFSGPSIN
jgi:arginine repressor